MAGLPVQHTKTGRYCRSGDRVPWGSDWRFANRDIDFYSVESFMGNLNVTMDGHRLPSRNKYIENLTRFPNLRANLVPGDSALAAVLFENASIDFLFIDGCHETPAVI
jgi:hypothetical protein